MGLIRTRKKKKSKKKLSNVPIKPRARSAASPLADKSLCCVCGHCFIPGERPALIQGSKAHLGCATSTVRTRGQEAVLSMRSEGDTVS